MSLRNKLFERLTALTAGSPWLTLAAGLLLTVVAGGAAEGLKMETRVLDLLPGDDPASVEFNDIVRQYSSASQLILGVSGDDKEQLIAFAEAFEERIGEATFTDAASGEARPFAKRIQVRTDVDFIAEHGLMLVKERDLQNLDEIFQDLDLAALLGTYNDFLEREYVEDSGSVTEREKEDRAIDSLKNLVFWLEGVERAGNGSESLEAHAEGATDLLTVGNPYMFAEDDQLLIALITPAVSLDEFEAIVEGMTGMWALVHEMQADYPDLEVRMTGMPALSYDDMTSGLEDMGYGTVVSLFAVLALFVLAFRMWTAPLLAMVNLIVGITWTSGFIALTVGRLNLFTLMFAIILIGLGIDFAIHMNAGFSTARSEGKGIREALAEMYRRAGAGVITGAVTTSAAFFAMMLTDLDALEELGLVLGAGILFTLLASLTVLPAMYAIHARVGDRIRRRRGGGELPPARPVRLAFPFLGGLGRLVQRSPWPALVAFVLVTAGLGLAVRGAEFEGDMLNLLPQYKPSITLHRDILERFELNADYVMVTAPDLETARPIVKKLKKNRLVGRVDAITELVPSEKQQQKRRRIIEPLRERMAAIAEPAGPGYGEVTDEQAARFLEEIERLQLNVQEIGQLAYTSVKKRLQRACDRLGGGENEKFSQILDLKRRLAGHADLKRKMAAYQQVYAPLLAAKLVRMGDTSPITVGSLPDSIRDRYVSSEGNNLISVYASVSLWDEGKTDLFLAATQKAADRVTGSVVLMDKLITLVGSRGLMATLLALGAVFLIMLVDFRHLGYALLGMMPLVGGFVWMVGLFVLTGRPFDVVNVMAFPLILGIGIDDAVHVLHAVRREGVGALPEVLRHTGRALLLTSLTTGIAFGSIAFASHVGMAGIGQLLALGVAACFVASVVLLPALVRIFLRAKRSKDPGKEPNHA